MPGMLMRNHGRSIQQRAAVLFAREHSYKSASIELDISIEAGRKKTRRDYDDCPWRFHQPLLTRNYFENYYFPAGISLIEEP